MCCFWSSFVGVLHMANEYLHQKSFAHILFLFSSLRFHFATIRTIFGDTHVIDFMVYFQERFLTFSNGWIWRIKFDERMFSTILKCSLDSMNFGNIKLISFESSLCLRNRANLERENHTPTHHQEWWKFYSRLKYHFDGISKRVRPSCHAALKTDKRK